MVVFMGTNSSHLNGRTHQRKCAKPMLTCSLTLKRLFIRSLFLQTWPLLQRSVRDKGGYKDLRSGAPTLGYSTLWGCCLLPQCVLAQCSLCTVSGLPGLPSLLPTFSSLWFSLFPVLNNENQAEGAVTDTMKEIQVRQCWTQWQRRTSRGIPIMA